VVGILIIGLVVLLIVWILVVPIRLDADSDLGRCRISQPGTLTFTASVDEKIHFDASIFGISLPVNRRTATPNRAKKQRVISKKEERSKSTYAYFFLVRKLIHSFQVNVFSMDIDTDDVIVNAQLIPVFLWLNKDHVNLTTNNVGRVYFHLNLQCRVITIVGTFIQFMFKK
jgi:hypothetical protein